MVLILTKKGGMIEVLNNHLLIVIIINVQYIEQVKNNFSFLQTLRCMPKEDSGCGAGGLHYVFKDAVKHTNWDVYIRTKFGYVQNPLKSFMNKTTYFDEM